MMRTVWIAAVIGLSVILSSLTPLTADTVWSVDTTRKQVAFTFDDGPKPESSIPLIDMLEKLQVRATFFVVGHEAQANIDLIKRLHEQGHEIANHTTNHRRLTALSDEEILSELEKTNAIIRSATGESPRLFRPPGGQFNTKVIQIAASLGLTVVLWDVNAGDYVLDVHRFPVKDESRREDGASFAQSVIAKITTQAKPGSIILMHNGGDVIELLPTIVTKLRNRGFEIVTVGELLREGKPRPNSIWNNDHVPD